MGVYRLWRALLAGILDDAFDAEVGIVDLRHGDPNRCDVTIGGVIVGTASGSLIPGMSISCTLVRIRAEIVTRAMSSLWIGLERVMRGDTWQP